ncbi:MAG: hypothetical protein AUJ71_03870 [Candidatus Omnitrophica bacterium CG1_02_49_16]|uniref:Uncharacterized protein n=1 Tax=Candidatus Falkowbacteria bacterium CG10_big_fil_rev_8_21_14_0_10_43_11 TaxID=1974568 RepID=A0A2M6WN66_9BACT|nr:MAG: hypothetical protein AUJ71_03870 [Candidatus Omnitrophica bacterium CG1_02_49_16]PIT94184.1 MAG: hypothetical protein COU00_00340 [Candidatus Falkowbacteria bacterium CG10_big_fil_rev_8_21_14_0_10_43_11]
MAINAPPLSPTPLRHITQYEDVRWVTFTTKEDAYAAIRILNTKELHGIAFDIAAGTTLIVPAEVLPFFDEQKLQYQQGQLLSTSDLAPEECQRLRREQGTY